jgi:hypothetical protein
MGRLRNQRRPRNRSKPVFILLTDRLVVYSFHKSLKKIGKGFWVEQVRHDYGKLPATADDCRFTHQQSAAIGNALRPVRRVAYGLGQQFHSRVVAGFASDKVEARVKIYPHKAPEAQSIRMRPFMDRRAGYADAHTRGDQRKSNGFHRYFLNDTRLGSGCDASGNDLVERDSVKLARKAQNRIGGKVCHTDLGPLTQRMVGGHDDQAVESAYPFGNQPWLAHIALNQGEVYLAGAQMVKHIATAGHDLDDYFDIVRDCPKGLKGLADEAQLSGETGHAYPDGSRPPSRVTGQMRLGVRYTLKDWAGVAEQDFTRRQQLGTARQPQEKRQAKLFFQLMNAPGQSGLRDVEHIGRTLKATFFSNSNKIMEPSKIHIALHNSIPHLQ